MAAPDKPATRRLFFAIYPNAVSRQSLAAAARPLLTEGRPAPAGNLHVTLAFIGMADPACENCLTKQAEQIRTPPPFTIAIDRIGHFRKARILWLGPGRTPPKLAALRGRLVAAIQSCGHGPETGPWVPHITVARKVRTAIAGKLENPVMITVENFSLMESIRDADTVRYAELARFPVGN